MARFSGGALRAQRPICAGCESMPWASGAERRCICHGVNLDLGCGPHKQKGFVGTDMRDIPGVDLVFDLEKFPWPLPPICADKILCSHLFEHIDPKFSIAFLDEMWRVIKPQGQVLIAVPYAGSHGYWQDPTHKNPCNETTWRYFDPMDTSLLYTIYKPRPWKIVRCHWNPYHNMEVVLEPYKNPDGSPMHITFGGRKRRTRRRLRVVRKGGRR